MFAPLHDDLLKVAKRLAIVSWQGLEDYTIYGFETDDEIEKIREENPPPNPDDIVWNDDELKPDSFPTIITTFTRD